MATKRMFSKDIVGSDAFQDMPDSSQLLYFHLGMEADDDGFIGNPKKISRSIGMSEDDMKILVAKRFVLLFESGVLVIKHHRINNNWDKYNCKRTIYVEEFNQLYIKENKAYTKDSLKGESLQSENSLKTVFRREENRREENRREEKKENVAIAPSPSFLGMNPNTYSKKPRSPREFTNARRADLGKPPLQPKRTEKQDLALDALKLIDYFKQQFYEMHGEGVDAYFRGDSSENSKMVKLAKACVVFLGRDARAYVDDWLAGKGEFFSYDPSNAWSNSQMSKWKASKTMKKEIQNFMPTI